MGRPLVSAVIPARNERFLSRTVQDLLEHAAQQVEVIVVLDGYWHVPPDFEALPNDPRVRVLHRGTSHGMRPAINAAVELATGEYILKTDAHCMFDEGFDEKLAADCEPDWVSVPRRKRLDAENWQIQDVGGKPDIDYHYLSYPSSDPNDFGAHGLNGKVWDARNRDESLRDVLVDDLMSSQGSAWFMPRPYFHQLELMDAASYGTFWCEAQEVLLKVWLSGGRCVVNKKTFYAHLHKGSTHGRGYPLGPNQFQIAAAYSRRWMLEPGAAWPKATLPLSWLIEKFWPVPTWPADRALWQFTETEAVADAA